MKRTMLATLLVIASACGSGPVPLPDDDDFRSTPIVTAVDRASEVADLTDARTDMLEDIGNSLP